MRRRRPRDVAAADRLRLAWQRRSPRDVARTLHPGVELVVDGGDGDVAPRGRAVRGALPVATALVSALAAEVEVLSAQVNGAAGLTLVDRGRVVGVVAIEVERRRVVRLWLVLDPTKLQPWNP